MGICRSCEPSIHSPIFQPFQKQLRAATVLWPVVNQACTPLYTAPEFHELPDEMKEGWTLQTGDPALDVWSMGMVWFETMTFELPFAKCDASKLPNKRRLWC